MKRPHVLMVRPFISLSICCEGNLVFLSDRSCYSPRQCDIPFGEPRHESSGLNLVEFVHLLLNVASWVQKQHYTCSGIASAIAFDTKLALQPPFLVESAHQAKGSCSAV